jgi:hypothetical protein
VLGRVGSANSRDPMALRMDLAKSRPDRFCPILAIPAVSGALRVRARSRIARTRADFDQFSDISKNLETEMWSKLDLNPGPLNRFCSDNCPRIWRDIRDEIKAAVLQRILSPRIRLALPNLLVLHRHECSSPPRQMISSFPVPEGRTLLRYCSDRSCWHRNWRRPKTEIPSGLDFRLRLLTIVLQKFTLR